MRPRNPPIASRGASLIEVLITIVVASVGFLGAAGVQMHSKQVTYEAMQRTTATLLAHDILERMRTNRRELETYLDGSSVMGGGTMGAEPSPDCSPGNACIPYELAQHDLWEWERAVDGAAESSGGNDTGGLSEPTACITGPAGGGTGVYSVALVWRGRFGSTDSTLSSCGQGSGLYDGVSGPDSHRQVVTVSAFIDVD